MIEIQCPHGQGWFHLISDLAFAAPVLVLATKGYLVTIGHKLIALIKKSS